MIKEYEDHFKSFDQTEISYRFWKSDDSTSNKSLIITHGHGEHSNYHDKLARNIVKETGLTVIGWDMRGHGQSEGQRGHAKDLHTLTNDYQEFIQELKGKEILSSSPLVFGHSMGGLVTSLALINKKIEAQAVILCAPAFGLGFNPNPVKKAIAKFAAKHLPPFTLWNEVKHSKLSQVKETLENYDTDHLFHDRISPQFYLGMLDAFEIIEAKAHEIKIPLLMQLAKKDFIVSTPKATDIFNGLSQKEKDLKVYDDSFHDIYNDLQAKEATADTINFINKFKES